MPILSLCFPVVSINIDNPSPMIRRCMSLSDTRMHKYKFSASLPDLYCMSVKLLGLNKGCSHSSSNPSTTIVLSLLYHLFVTMFLLLPQEHKRVIMKNTNVNVPVLNVNLN